MPRRSKASEEVIESESIEKSAPDSEDTQFINAADIEAAEAELLSEESNEEAEVEAAPKPRRSRSRRKKPELSIENAASEPEDKETGTEITAAEEEPKPRRRSRKPAEEKVAIPSADPGFAAMNMEEVMKQWAAIKDITTVISQNLNAKAPQHPKMTDDTFVDTSELFRPQVQKVPFIVKFATGASLVASLLSVLSLSLSQSARNAVLTSQLASTKTLQPTAIAQSPISSAPQIASNPLPKRIKETFFKIKK